MSGPRPRPAVLTAAGWTLPRVVAAVAALLVLAVWVSSGSLVMALLVLVLVGGVAALGVVLFAWVARSPRPVGGELPTGIPAALPTTDLDHVPGPADRVRRALRGLLARPWVRGDALVRAATARLASEDALVFTPRGQRVAAPHVWVEWNTGDLAEVAGRWPLDVLAQELADGYVEHAAQAGVRRLADRTWVHLLAGPDVPVGRVVVTAAFSRPQQTATASACAPADAARPAPPARPLPAPPPRRPAARPLPRRAALPVAETTGVTTTGVTTTGVTTTGVTTTGVVVSRSDGPADTGTGSPVWRRVLPALRTMRAPRPAVPGTLGVLVAESPGVADIVLDGGTGSAVVVGRDPHGGVVVDHPGVSWRHLTITRRDASTWLVVDAGSTNGTFVGGTRVQAIPVRPGDTVGLGGDGPHYRLALRTRHPDAGRSPDRTRVEVT